MFRCVFVLVRPLVETAFFLSVRDVVDVLGLVSCVCGILEFCGGVVWWCSVWCRHRENSRELDVSFGDLLLLLVYSSTRSNSQSWSVIFAQSQVVVLYTLHLSELKVVSSNS